MKNFNLEFDKKLGVLNIWNILLKKSDLIVGFKVLFLEDGILKKDGLIDDLNLDEIFKS